MEVPENEIKNEKCSYLSKYGPILFNSVCQNLLFMCCLSSVASAFHPKSFHTQFVPVAKPTRVSLVMATWSQICTIPDLFYPNGDNDIPASEYGLLNASLNYC